MTHSDLTIRAVRPEEAAVISDLALRSKASWGYSQEFIENCREELRYSADQIESERWWFVVAQSSEQIVGLLALYELESGELPFQPEPAMELAGLFIEPVVLGKGVGRRLVEVARERARACGHSVLYIQSDPYAAPFYTRMGAETIGAIPSGSIPGRSLPLMQMLVE